MIYVNYLCKGVLTSVISNRQFAEIYKELKQISSKGLLSRINSSVGDKEKIQDCAAQINELVSSVQLQLGIATYREALVSISSD